MLVLAVACDDRKQFASDDLKSLSQAFFLHAFSNLGLLPL